MVYLIRMQSQWVKRYNLTILQLEPEVKKKIYSEVQSAVEVQIWQRCNLTLRNKRNPEIQIWRLKIQSDADVQRWRRHNLILNLTLMYKSDWDVQPDPKVHIWPRDTTWPQGTNLWHMQSHLKVQSDPEVQSHLKVQPEPDSELEPDSKSTNLTQRYNLTLRYNCNPEIQTWHLKIHIWHKGTTWPQGTNLCQVLSHSKV